jgi:hypothetical protein
MSRPPFEVADIIRSAGDAFREQYGSSLTWPQHKVLDAILRCRTAALGGHRDQWRKHLLPTAPAASFKPLYPTCSAPALPHYPQPLAEQLR